MHALLLAVLLAAPTRLAKCDSGKTGKLELFVHKTDAGWTLSSKDPTGARVLVGTVTSAKHQKLDKRHHVYVFQVDGGQLTQAAGLDKEHCQPDADSKVERCAFSELSIKLAKRGPVEPGDEGLSVGVEMDNGDPKGCTVYASKALTALLAAGR